MKKEAYAESTIKAVGSRLEQLQRHATLAEPEQVKAFVAEKQCSNAFKESLIEAYDLYCKANGIAWQKPFYQRYDKQPKIPTERSLDLIIANASRKMALVLSVIRDLGLRPIEITWLRVRDIDLESGNVTVTSAKYCVGRTLKLKTPTLAMLKTYVSEHEFTQNDRLFPLLSGTVSENYRRIRNRVGEKLGMPELLSIRLYDFRHFKASMEYHRTKDLLYVKALLGHKDLRTTLRYTQLINFEGEEYSSAVAKNVNEAQKLVESGFEHVTTFDNLMLFRKRK